MQRCHTYKLQSQNIFKESTGGGGSRVGGVRMDVNEEVKFLRKLKLKKSFFFFFGGGGGGGGGLGQMGSGWGVRVDVNREVKFL